MLGKGDLAPSFDLPDQVGQTRSLSEFLGRGDTVVYFYPADFTPVCTAQACAVRDMGETLDAAGVEIVGISPSSEDSHGRFADRYELGFPILTDHDKHTIKAWGVEGPLGFGVRRATFWVSQDGVIQDRVVADLLVGSHTSFLNDVIKHLRADS